MWGGHLQHASTERVIFYDNTELWHRSWASGNYRARGSSYTAWAGRFRVCHVEAEKQHSPSPHQSAVCSVVRSMRHSGGLVGCLHCSLTCCLRASFLSYCSLLLQPVGCQRNLQRFPRRKPKRKRASIFQLTLRPVLCLATTSKQRTTTKESITYHVWHVWNKERQTRVRLVLGRSRCWARSGWLTRHLWASPGESSSDPLHAKIWSSSLVCWTTSGKICQGEVNEKLDTDRPEVGQMQRMCDLDWERNLWVLRR